MKELDENSVTVQFYSDSLGLPRLDAIEVKLTDTYIYKIQEFLRIKLNRPVFTVNRSKGGATISELYEMFAHDESYFYQNRKDVLIIHCGICDCAPRPVSLRFRKIISVLPSFAKNRIIKFLHDNRARLFSYGIKFYNTKSSEFEYILKKWIDNAKEKYKLIYVINIAPANAKYEIHSPGTMESIRNYNQIIRNVVDSYADTNVFSMNTFELIQRNEHNIDEYLHKLDGHHITSLTHHIIAEDFAKTVEINKILNG